MVVCICVLNWGCRIEDCSFLPNSVLPIGIGM